jgi:hypothetical protein
MSRRICLGEITGECRNPSKNSASVPGLECPYCLREDGKDGNGDKLCEPEKAIAVFEVLKDKVKE